MVSITPDEVERTTADAATVNGWSDRTQQKLQKYLKAASRYGHVKLKKLPEDPLTAVDMADLDTQPSTDGLEYSAEEVALLCTPGPGVDWRVTLAANIAADVGRRIGAIRRLRCEDVSVGERIWLRFRKETDKGRRESTVPVSAETAELILEALKRPEVHAGGWLLPGGHEGSKRRAGVSWGGADATSSAGPIHKLHEAERLLGIDHVRGRGYHGIERAHVTVSWDEASGDAAKVGDLTGNSSPEVLERHYRRKQKASQAAHVDAVRARFKGGAIPWSDTQKTRGA